MEIASHVCCVPVLLFILKIPPFFCWMHKNHDTVLFPPSSARSLPAVRTAAYTAGMKWIIQSRKTEAAESCRRVMPPAAMPASRSLVCGFVVCLLCCNSCSLIVAYKEPQFDPADSRSWGFIIINLMYVLVGRLNNLLNFSVYHVGWLYHVPC